MKKSKKFGKKITSMFFAMALVIATLMPYTEAMAATVTDKINVGNPAFDGNGDLRYSSCLGSGNTLYKSIVISFTSVCANGETAVLPTVSGFNYESSLSSAATFVVNMPDGKNLASVASYIRKVVFKNCQSSTNHITFSIGKEEVHYMTLYSESTGHFYQFVPFKDSEYNAGKTSQNGLGQSMSYGTWMYSYYEALNMTYEGLQGYMVTITSIPEDAFIRKNSAKVGWLGATRMVGNNITSKNGISYYKSFTINTANSGSWYWAAGPELANNSATFLTVPTATLGDLNTAKANGFYNNWNKKDFTSSQTTSATEPNNAGGEYCATTLLIGKGYETSGASGRINSSSPYYIESGYSWNDVDNARWAIDGSTVKPKTTDYQTVGFFVEYGTSLDGSAAYNETAFTGFVFNTQTASLVHTWEGASETGSNQIDVYCNRSGADRCTYYGTSSSHQNYYPLTLDAPNMPYSGSAYNLASLDGDTVITEATGAETTDIEYYSVDIFGATTGGTKLDDAPSAKGYYYAKVGLVTKNTTGGNNTTYAVSAFKIYDPSADFEIDTLNNRINDDGKKVDTITATATPTSDLKVHLSSSTDDVSLVKLGDIAWTNTGTEQNPKYVLGNVEWVSLVKTWLGDTGSTRRTTYGNTPEELAAKSQAVQTAFFKELLRTSNDKVINEDALSTAADGKLTAATAGSNATDSYLSVAEQQQDSDGYYNYYTDIKMGLYAVIVPGQAIAFAKIYPETRGAKTTYTIQKLFEVSIKQAEPTIEKYINGEKQDTIQIDTPVEFTVDFQLQEYTDRTVNATKADRNVMASANDFFKDSGYSIYFLDEMAPGYTIDQESVKLQVYYEYTEASQTKSGYKTIYDLSDTSRAVPTSSPYQFTETKITGSKLLWKGTKPEGDDVAENGVTSYTKNEDLAGKYVSTRTNAKIFDDIAITKSTSSSTNTTIRINFDEPAVRKYISDNKSVTVGENTINNITIKKFRLVYTATPDKDAVIGEDGNPNDAYIYYESNAAGTGTPSKMNDKVVGYTYGLKLIKIDGTEEDETKKYLSGAEFKLFKEIEIPSGKTAASDDYKDASTYYIMDNRVFEWVKINNGDFALDGSNNSTSIIISVASSDGVTIHGLGDGCYILMETKAPGGYNDLAEDVYFEINKLSSSELALKGNYSIFKELKLKAEDDATYNANGYIELQVLNYKGLTLPSTGGMGTLIFTVIGIILMTATIIVIVIKRKNSVEYLR